MCEPVTIIAAAGLAISAAAAIQSNQATAAAAEAQAAASRKATTDNYAQDTQQQILVAEQAWQKQNAQAIATRSALATSATGAGEAGVSGTSVDALSRSYFAREGQYDDSVNINRDADLTRLQLQQQGFQDQGQSAMNNIQQPNDFATAATIAGAGLKAYDRLYVPTTSAAKPAAKGTAGS